MTQSATRIENEEETGLTRPGGQEGTMAIATTRASQEVQAAMIIAKKFPRDETASINRILQSCKRRGLAEAAVYSYPRGDSTVEGPSIRLAEAMAQAWGNVDFGIVELEQKNGESQVMAYAWDLETNTRQTKIFAVPHKRHTKRGDYRLTDPRDIYEMVANNGARRLRACILGIIPGDVQDLALAQVDKTLKAGHAEPLIDRVRAMIGAFSELGVTQAMIEGRLQHKSEVISEAEIVGLRKIYRSLTDGMAKREDFFDFGTGDEGAVEGKSRADRLAEKLATEKQPEQAPPAAAEGQTGSPPRPGRPGPRKEPAAPPEHSPMEEVLPAAEQFVAGLTPMEVRAFLDNVPPDIKAKAMQIANTNLDDKASAAEVRACATNAKAMMILANGDATPPEAPDEAAEREKAIDLDIDLFIKREKAKPKGLEKVAQKFSSPAAWKQACEELQFKGSVSGHTDEELEPVLRRAKKIQLTK